MSDREVTFKAGVSVAHLLGAGVGAVVMLAWHSFTAGISVQDTYATKMYVDTQDKRTLEQAYEKSDRNHDDMEKKVAVVRGELMLIMGTQSSDLKVQGVKIDQVLKDMTEIKDQIRSSKRN